MIGTDFADFGDITADELLDRQWEFFCDELDDETVLKFIGDWTGELKDLGAEFISRTSVWVNWCYECPEISEAAAIVLAERLKFLFVDYQDDWNGRS